MGSGTRSITTALDGPLRYAHALRRMFLAALICLPLSSMSQPADPADTANGELPASQQLEQIDQYEQRINQLQQRHGPYDPSLSEPMQALSEAYLATGDLEEAVATLEERMQVHRISQGLYSPEQIPVMESLLDVQAQRREWEEVNNLLASLGWLYDRAEGLDTEQRLNGLRQLSGWQLRLMTEATPEQQASHLLERRRLRQQALELAREAYEADSEQLTEVNYERALADLEIALAIFADADAAVEIIADLDGVRADPTRTGRTFTSVAEVEQVYGARTNTVSSRSFRRRMRNHFETLSDLRDRFADHGDQEAEAMALLYMADSVLIRQQYERTPRRLAGPDRGSGSTGSAAGYYEQAWELLQESGIGNAMLERHLGCPARLPREVFIKRLSELPECGVTEDGHPRLADFHALSEVLPGIGAEPGAMEEETEAEGPVAVLRFEVAVNGQASRPSFEQIEPDSTSNRIRMDELLQDMQFRPALEAGQPRATETVSMRMRLPPRS